MKKLAFQSLLCVLLIPAVFAGCSGDPVTTPSENQEINKHIEAGCCNSHNLLGYYELSIDSGNMGVEVVPVRTADIHINVVGVLNNTMGVGAAMVPGESDPANGLFVLDITMTHPFGLQEQFAGFDVKGILITPGTLTFSSLVFADTDETRLENADGYTRWWNPAEFTAGGILGYTNGILATAAPGALTATVNPYKYFADVLNEDDSMSWVTGTAMDDPAGRGVFTAGASNTRRYEIRFPMAPGPKIIYGYAVDASWDAPSPNPPSEIPDDFPIEANQPEAYRLALTIDGNSLYYDSDTGDSGGWVLARLNVYDWQGQLVGDIPTEVDTVRIYAPDVVSGGVDGSLIDENSLRAQYGAEIHGSPSAPGRALMIARVESPSGNYIQAGAPAPDAPVSAYHVATVDVIDPECVGDANNDWSEAFEIGFGEVVSDQVCLPADYRDFYTFEIPAGSVASGRIRLFLDPEPSKVGLYDSNEVLIEEQNISGGYAEISIDDLELNPGDYYIRVYTSNATNIGPYILQLNGELSGVEPTNVVNVTPPGFYVDPNYVWFHDNYAILFSFGLWIYDMTDPADPQLVHEQIPVPNHYSNYAAMNWPYLYYTHPSGGGDQISMIDLSDIENPVYHEDVLSFFGSVHAIELDDNYLYIALSQVADPDFLIFDYITNPDSPGLLGTMNTCWQIKVIKAMPIPGENDHIAIASETMLEAYDVGNPMAPVFAGDRSVPTGWILSDLDVSGKYIYTVSKDAADDGYMDVFELKTDDIYYINPANTPGTSDYITIHGEYAYIADGEQGLTTVNISDPIHPTLESTQAMISDAERLAANNSIVGVIPYMSSLTTFDIETDPSIPSDLGTIPVLNRPTSGHCIRDNYMLIGDFAGLQDISIIDVTEPENASIIKQVNVSAPAYRFAADGDLAAIGGKNTVALVDISDPLNPAPYPTPYTYVGPELDNLAIKGNALYVLYHDAMKAYIRVINVSDPSSPSDYTTIYFDSFYTACIEFYGDFMYMDSDAGVEVYSVLIPYMPDHLGTYTCTDYIFEIEIQGHYLYVYYGSSEIIEIVDLTNPSSPEYVGSGINGAISSGDMAISGQFAYFSGNDPNIYAAWIWPPESPQPYDQVCSHYAAGSDLYAHDNYLYKNNLGTGLSIFRLYE